MADKWAQWRNHCCWNIRLVLLCYLKINTSIFVLFLSYLFCLFCCVVLCVLFYVSLVYAMQRKATYICTLNLQLAPLSGGLIVWVLHTEWNTLLVPSNLSQNIEHNCIVPSVKRHKQYQCSGFIGCIGIYCRNTRLFSVYPSTH